MAEMIVTAPDVKRFVDDYDFTFIGGIMMPVTVNVEAGDTIEFGTDIQIHLTAKPSPNNPKTLLPVEDITIHQQHLLATQKRTREVIEMTPEQQHEWAKTLKQLGGVQ